MKTIYFYIDSYKWIRVLHNITLCLVFICASIKPSASQIRKPLIDSLNIKYKSNLVGMIFHPLKQIPPNGYLSVLSTPSSLNLWVDYRDTEKKTPVLRLTLSADYHLVKVESLKFNVARESTVTINEGLETKVDFTLISPDTTIKKGGKK